MSNNRIKCKTLAGPSLVAFALLPWQIIILAVSLLIAGPKLLVFVYVGIIYVINSSIVSLIYRNAFSIVEIDEVGIKNKSIKRLIMTSLPNLPLNMSQNNSHLFEGSDALA